MSKDKKPFGSTKNISELKVPFYYVYLRYIGDKPYLIRINKIDYDILRISECLPTKSPHGLQGVVRVKELTLQGGAWPKERVLFQNYFLAWAYYQKILARYQKLLALKPSNQ